MLFYTAEQYTNSSKLRGRISRDVCFICPTVKQQKTSKQRGQLNNRFSIGWDRLYSFSKEALKLKFTMIISFQNFIDKN